jgi:hypothetical protein
LSRGGTLILSGILATEIPDLRAAYAGAGTPSVLEDGEWAALIVRIGG